MSANRLCCWKAGEVGMITELFGDSEFSARLAERGVIPGAWVRMIQHGNTMLIQINDSRVCLRREDAKLIGAHGIEAGQPQLHAPTVQAAHFAPGVPVQRLSPQ